MTARNIPVGSPLAFHTSKTQDAVVHTPSGQTFPLTPVVVGDERVYRFFDTQLPGEYVVKFGAVPKPEDDSTFFVERDPEESQLALLGDEQKSGLAAASGAQFTNDPTSTGQRDLTVRFAGATFRPGEWVYADEDGIIVSRRALL